MKYLIDTCVVSELANRHPVPGVREWLKAQDAATATVHGLQLVTRNVSDMEGMGLRLPILNPFSKN